MMKPDLLEDRRQCLASGLFGDFALRRALLPVNLSISARGEMAASQAAQ
jgi:hypothetical protein